MDLMESVDNGALPDNSILDSISETGKSFQSITIVIQNWLIVIAHKF